MLREETDQPTKLCSPSALCDTNQARHKVNYPSRAWLYRSDSLARNPNEEEKKSAHVHDSPSATRD